MAQPIEVVSIFIAAGDRRDTRHHHFEHRVSDAVCIAAIGHRVGKSPAYTERALFFSQQQEPATGGLVAAVKINCELLAADRWKIEGKRRMRLVTEGRRKRRSPGRSRPPRLLVDGNPTQHVAHRVERRPTPVGSKMLAFAFPVVRCRGKQRCWSRRPADHLIGRKVSSTGSEEPGAA
jgi:hypothetical protein